MSIASILEEDEVSRKCLLLTLFLYVSVSQ